MDRDICASLLQIVTFPSTWVISFNPNSWGIHRKFYRNFSQGDLGHKQKPDISAVTMALQFKKEKCNCLTSWTVGIRATLHSGIQCGNISTSSPWPSIKFRLTVFQRRHKCCPACYLSPGKLRWDFCCLILSV